MCGLDLVPSVGFWIFSGEKMKCKHSLFQIFPQHEISGWGATVAVTFLCDWGVTLLAVCQAVWAVVAMLPEPDIIQAMLMNVITLTVN
jgi:hypothetical protein